MKKRTETKFDPDKHVKKDKKKITGSKLIIKICIIIGLIILLVLGWKTNFAGIREFVKTELAIIADIFELIFNF